MKKYINLLSIIIPVYLGENTTQALTEKLKKNLQYITPDYEIILVNDASPDSSWKKIKEECIKDKRIKGINLSRNAGQHAAISAGLKYAFGEKIVIMDCDLQDNPEELPKLWAKSQEGFDIVMARRINRKDKLITRFFSQVFHFLYSLLKGIKTDPAIANYAIYNRIVIEEHFKYFSHKAFSVLDLVKKFSFSTVDIQSSESAREKSSYTLKKRFKLAYSLFFPKKQTKEENSLYIIEQTENISIEKYDVKLLPLTRSKIEMIRQWRNDPKISQYMEYREIISPEMQQKWFESVCNQNNYYFLIEFEGKEIGMTDIKKIDYCDRSSEGGIFIYDDNYLNSDVAIRVSLCSIDFGTDILNTETGIAHILRDNKRAIDYNKMLGYVLLPGQEDIEKQKYILSKDNYFKQRKLLLKLIS